jgi:hypothetical protein
MISLIEVYSKFSVRRILYVSSRSKIRRESIFIELISTLEVKMAREYIMGNQ